MSEEIDITGKRFGKLTALKKISGSHWLFICDCGRKEIKPKETVTRGISKRCRTCGRSVTGIKNSTHRMSETRLYECWRDMRNRCYLKTQKNYSIYGGRGIKVCEEWKNNSSSFIDWALKNGYKDNLTIDRIDVNGNYCPENCRWITRNEQAKNKTTNVYITIDGKTKILSDWVKIAGISFQTYYNRKKKGLSDKDCFFNKRKPYTEYAEYLAGGMCFGLFYLSLI